MPLLHASRLLSSLGSLTLVVGATSGLVRGLDALPAVLTAASQERSFASVDELERASGHRLALPSYFPATLKWPPVSVRALGRRPRAAVLGIAPREGGAERLLIAQTLDGSGEVPKALLPPGVVMDSETVIFQGAKAKLDRLLGEDGYVWHELRWTRGNQALLFRSRGAVEPLLRMADSVTREGHE